MTIAFKLRIFFTVILFISLIFGYSFWKTSQNLRTQVEVNQIAQSLIKTVFEFGGITTEYIHNRNDRVQSQWKNNHAAIEFLFYKASNKLYLNDDRKSLKKIMSNEQHAERLITILISKSPSKHNRKEIQVASQIRVRIQGMLSEASRMSKRSLIRLNKAEQRLEYTSALLLLIYLLFFIISLILIKYKLLNPIVNLQQNAEKLTLGDYDARIPVSGKDEISSLATSYNKLAIVIQKKINSLTQQSNELSDSQQELLKLNNNLQDIVEVKTSVLKNSENKQRAILESITDGVITLDNNYIIKNINPAVTTIYDYKLDDLINRNIIFLISDLKNVKKNSSILYEKEGHHKNGTNFPIEVTLNRLFVNDTVMYACIVRDITVRKKNQKMQVEFVSNVSHELRTPLTSIRGALGLVNSGTLDELPEKRNELLATAYSNTERLMNLINDLLDMQKIEAGKLDFNTCKIHLTDAMHKALIDNDAYAKHHNVTIEIGETVDDIDIKTDPLRLDQVMSNLLSNAAKFSPKGSKIIINTALSGTFAKITVVDSGEGIPKEYYSTIFGKFTQNDASATRQKGGTGLGLAITKQIVEAMMGSIVFTSVVGEGTTFIVYLPIVDQSVVS